MNYVKRKDKRVALLAVVLSVTLMLFPLLSIGKNNLPYIYNDEFGYWVSAAKYAGFEWNGVFNRISYYSYGYGLILSLLYKITDNTQILYNLALVLNGIWLLGSFYFLYKIGKKMYPHETENLVLFVAFVATCVAGNITQVNYTWPENLLFFLFCILAYLVLLLKEKVTIVNLVLIAIVSVFSYMVHQRTMVFLIAITMIVVLMLFLRRIKVRDVLIFAGTIGIIFLVHFYLKEDITNSIWSGGEALSINNFSGQVGKINSLFSMSGIRNLFLSMAGKIFYMISVSIWLIYFVVEDLFCYIKDTVVYVIKKQRESVDIYKLFLLLIFCGTIAIGAIFMLAPNGTVHVVYGRYNEHIFGPFLVYAFLELKNRAFDSWKIWRYLLYTILLAICVVCSVNIFETAGTAEVNSVALADFVSNTEINVGAVILLSSIGFIIISYLICNKSSKAYCGYILCLVIWVVMGYNAYTRFDANGLGNATQSTKECVLEIERIEERIGEEMTIYAMSDGESYPFMFPGNGIQYCMPERDIEYITETQIRAHDYNEKCIIIAPVTIRKPDSFKIVYKSNMYYVMIPVNLG